LSLDVFPDNGGAAGESYLDIKAGIAVVLMDDFSPAELDRIEQATQRVGRSLFERLGKRRPGIWDRRWWDDRIMQWAMADESVKVQMFRFIDVLPMLRSNEAIAQHLHEYFEVRRGCPRRPGWGGRYADAARRNRCAIAAPQRYVARAPLIAGRDA
jgi:hypothetical protein